MREVITDRQEAIKITKEKHSSSVIYSVFLYYIEDYERIGYFTDIDKAMSVVDELFESNRLYKEEIIKIFNDFVQQHPEIKYYWEYDDYIPNSESIVFKYEYYPETNTHRFFIKDSVDYSPVLSITPVKLNEYEINSSIICTNTESNLSYYRYRLESGLESHLSGEFDDD